MFIQKSLFTSSLYLFFWSTIGLASSYAELVTLFEENFESYAHQSDIRSQNGWTGAEQTTSNQNTFLGSSVLNGFHQSNGNSQDISYNDVTIDNQQKLVLQGDFYAGTGPGYHTHVAGLSLRNAASEVLGIIFMSQNPNTGEAARWRMGVKIADGPDQYFDLTTGGIGLFTHVHAKMEWDELSGEFTASVAFDDHYAEHTVTYTNDYSINDGARVQVLNDHRGSQTGMEFDNLLLQGELATPVPEPNVIILLTLAGLGLIIYSKRKNSFNQI